MGDAQEIITAFWDMVAPGYEAHPGNVPDDGTEEHGRWVDAFRQALPDEPSDVLDVATGTGFVARIAASLGHRTTGIDLAPSMLVEAARRAPTVAFREGDAVDPPFPPGSFDVVTSRFLLWTLRHPERAFTAWRAVLRPGGRVVAVDGFWFHDGEPDLYSPEVRAQLPLMTASDPGADVDLLERAGFGVVTVTQLVDLPNEDAGGALPFLVVAR